MNFLRLFCALLIVSAPTFAEDPLTLTQQDLTDPALRQKVLDSDPQAAAANEKLKQMVGGNSANMADSYKMAADVFGKIVQESGGNDAAIEEKLLQLQANPNAMAGYLTEEQKQKIQEMTKGLSQTPAHP